MESKQTDCRLHLFIALHCKQAAENMVRFLNKDETDENIVKA